MGLACAAGFVIGRNRGRASRGASTSTVWRIGLDGPIPPH